MLPTEKPKLTPKLLELGVFMDMARTGRNWG